MFQNHHNIYTYNRDITATKMYRAEKYLYKYYHTNISAFDVHY